MGKGGGQSAPANQTVKQENAISAYAQPYVENMLGKAEALTSQPYQTYPGQRTAEFTGLQNQAFGGAGDLGVAQQVGQGTALAGAAGLGALNTQYGGEQFGNTYQGVPLYNPGRFNQQRVGVQQFTGDQVGQYMSPYLQQSLAPQIAEANRQYDISGVNQQAKATQAGAFGGSREAIMAAENERNRNMGLQSIVGQGYNTAFNNAQNQFNQAQQQGLQAQQANQQTNLATQQAQQQANQFGYGQLANQAQNYAQYGQAANALNAQQQQFGANLGMQGLQQANQAASTLGQLGQTQFGQQTGAIGLQNQLGTQQQQQQQNIMNQQYQDFLTQKQNPYNQLSFMQNMLAGLPMQSSVQNVYSNPSMLSQVAGLGTAAAGAYGLSRMGGAKGGLPKDFEKKRPAGLAELAIHKMA